MALMKLNFIDHSDESSSFNINIPELDISNVENYTSEVATNFYADVRAAVEALSLMSITGGTVSAKNSSYPFATPADANAQRERKLLLKFTDNVTGKKGSITVPGVNLALVASQGGDNVPLTQPQVAALVALLEAGARSNIGNPITFYAAKHVGVNS